jgi:hypothetical protein
MKRLAIGASVATDLFLLAALVAWQWVQRRPAATASLHVPVVLALFSLGCGAVALVACRRRNLVLLFLLDFSAVLVAAWLFDRLYRQLAASHPFWLR